MIRVVSNAQFRLLSLTSLGLVFASGACGSSPRSFGNATAGGAGDVGLHGGNGGARSSMAGSGAVGGRSIDAGGSSDIADVAGNSQDDAGRGNAAGAPGGTAGSNAGGAAGGAPPGSGGVAGSASGGRAGNGGTTGRAGSGGSTSNAGSAGVAGTGGSGGVILPSLVTSTVGAYWKTDGALTDSTATATVTVNDTTVAQKWEGMGAAFNELGWKYLSTTAMKNTALNLLFGAAEGANFAWGRIPIGASDYAESRYTLEDSQGSDPAPNVDESNRPAADASLSNFSLDRDKTKLIPYIKAAQAVKPDLRFWASPWTPPLWMKTGYKKNSGSDASANAKTPSYYDGGNMKSDAVTLTAYAQYFTKFVQGYKAQGINVELVSAQNEPGYDQNYPSCLWDKATYTTFIGSYLGPAMQSLNVKVMLGTLSNPATDFTIASAAVADAAAKPFLSLIGAQWDALDATKLDALNSGLPYWATEHKCGNYPWMAGYNSSQAPNDAAYAAESWTNIRNAIATAKVTSYNAWNMVLDKSGLGIDTTRDWKQNALLVADSGNVIATPAYYVFRHVSQYVMPGAFVVGTTGGDAIAFKNPDGSLVAVMYNSGTENPNYVVAIGGKKLSFDMPGSGWATIRIKP